MSLKKINILQLVIWSTTCLIYESASVEAQSSLEVAVPLVTFQASGPATIESTLAYKGTLKHLDVATFCFRLRIGQSRSTNTVFSYAVPDDGDEIHLSVNYKEQTLMFSCCNGIWKQETPMQISLREWLSICFSVELASWKWELVRNGRVKNGILNVTSSVSPKIRGGGSLIIGQEQDAVRAAFNEFESLSGRLADLRLHDTILPTEQMVNYTTCKYFQPESPIVDFSNIQRDYTVEEVILSDIRLLDTCITKRNFDIVFPELRDFEAGDQLCNIVGGVLTIPTDSQYNERLFNISLPYAESCGDGFAETLWLGVRGDVVSQTWLTHPDSLPLTYSKFDKNDGLPIKHPDVCMAFIGSKETVPDQYGLWVPSDCRLEMCPVCHFDIVVIMRIRGLCEQSEFDRDYFLSHDQDSLSFTGVYYSEILKNPPNQSVVKSDYGYWTMKRLDKPRVVGILPMKSPIHYPIGLNTWIVDNDVCGKEKVELMMTSCQDYKFSCSDGTCINLHQRCDLETDCPDGTDEVGCYFLTLPKGYDGLIPPSRPDRNQPVKVYLYITLLSIRKIDLSNFHFISELEVQFRWIDERLIYHHLNFEETLNTVSGEERMPWVPQMEFLGDGDTTSFVEPRRSSLLVRRYSEPLPDNDENIYEDELFDAKLNPLILVKKLTVTTCCEFNLEAFPFDKQTCNMGVVLSGITKEYVILVPDGKGVQFVGQRKLLEYRLTTETMERQDEGNYSGQVVRLTFQNMSNFYVTSTYIPTFVIVIIGYLVFFFPIWNFNERVMVGLTGLLVEATFFSQVSSSIPHTAYLKLVDIWFVYCIVVLFLVVVALVIINWLQEESSVSLIRPVNAKGNGRKIEIDPQAVRKERARKFNSICRVMFPILTIVFLIGYGLSACFM